MSDKEKLPENQPEGQAEADIETGVEAEGVAEASGSGVDEEAIEASPETPEATDAEATDAEATDAEATDAEATDAEATEAEATDAEATDAEATDAEATEAEATDAEATDAEASETPVDTGPPKRWYVVHTYSGHENKVRDNIQKMINASGIKDHFGQIIVPTEEVTEMRKGKKTVTTRKFFPSYILVEMHMTDESRHLISDIPGVTSFVGTASGPQPLSKAEVERILGRMDKEKQTIIPEIPFALGEHIRIKDGPFSDFTGVIDEINAERGKLKVLVSIFGRETPVELDFLQVENL